MACVGETQVETITPGSTVGLAGTPATSPGGNVVNHDGSGAHQHLVPDLHGRLDSRSGPTNTSSLMMTLPATATWGVRVT